MGTPAGDALPRTHNHIDRLIVVLLAIVCRALRSR